MNQETAFSTPQHLRLTTPRSTFDVERSTFDVQRSPLGRLEYSVLQQCMHCGMCLPSCPTYALTGRERKSPRGRISLMRAVVDGELGIDEGFADEMSHCLGCLACTSACPAGVDYGALFEAARASVEESGVRDSRRRRLLRAVTLRYLFRHPPALRLVGGLLRLYQASGMQSLLRRSRLLRVAPRRLRELEAATPTASRRFSDQLIAEIEHPTSERRYQVAFLSGCVQSLLFADVNRATVDVLLENGCEVQTLHGQHCCGSLHAHNGDLQTAKELARKQIDRINPHWVDAIISNAGGCGSHLKHYDQLLADDPDYRELAAEWSRKVRDISEWLVEIGFRRPESAPAPVSATYHESCHLCHGQKVSAPPREILRAIPGLELRECGEASWCCGSAGVYSLTQPETATRLQQRKVGHLRATGAEVVVTGNPGCHLQIENGFHSSDDGSAPRVVHPVVLLAEAYGREAR